MRGDIFMSVAVLKLIACLGMLIDHLGSVFGTSGWGFLSPAITFYMRTIGRFVFPVFAFLVTNGWQYTRNKQRYFSNVVLFAIISQIPYTFAFYSVNREKIYLGEGPNYFPDPDTFYFYAAITLLFVFTYWYFALKRKFSYTLLWVAIAPLLFALPLKWHYVWFFYFDLNVMYTLALGMFAIFCWDKIFTEHSSKWYEYILMLGTFFIALRTLGNNSDYGYYGVFLVLAIYIVRKNRFAQASVLAFWGIFFYGIQYDNWIHAWAAALGAAVLILFYNGKKGMDLKSFFYVFYPGHLFLLGIINLLLRFN